MYTLEVTGHLLNRACTNKYRGDATLRQYPRQGHLCEGLTTFGSLSVKLTQVVAKLGSKAARGEACLARHTRTSGYSIEILVGKKSLGKRRIRDKANSIIGTILHNTILLRCAVEHIKASLIYKQGDITLTEIAVGKLYSLERPARDTHI
jgi:hypothetical protein